MKNQEPVERWQKYGVLPDPNPYGKCISIKKHNRLVVESVRLALADQKALSRAEALEEVRDKIEKLKVH